MRSFKKLLVKLIVSYLLVFTILCAIVFREEIFSKAHSSTDTNQAFALIEKKADSSAPPVKLQVLPAESPIRLHVPRLNINLDIIDGTYTSGKWELSKDKAHFATMTMLPNTVEGNTLIYGHNTDAVLNRTKNIEHGDTLILTTKNYTFTYSYSIDAFVAPTDGTILTLKTNPQVTLLTCNGIFDQYRRLMFFNLVDVKKNS